MDPAFGLTLWKTLAGALVVACLLARVTRRWQLAAIIALLLIDWAICTASPDLHVEKRLVWNWIACGITDAAVSAIIIIAFWEHVVAMAIAFILLCEVGAHLAFGLDNLMNGVTPYQALSLYWQITHWGAWLQAWLLVLWIGHHGLQMVGFDRISDGLRRIDRAVRAKTGFARAEKVE